MDSKEKQSIANQAANQQEEFVQLLTQNQNRIRAYIFSLVGDHTRAADILQETNLVLWRKIEEYDPQKSFLSWSFAIARFQVLAHIRDRKRDKVVLDEELIELIGKDAEEKVGQLESVQLALKSCLQKLSEKSLELIESRYFKSRSIAQVAESSGKTVGALKVALMRVRKQLGSCIQNQMAGENQRG